MREDFCLQLAICTIRLNPHHLLIKRICTDQYNPYIHLLISYQITLFNKISQSKNSGIFIKIKVNISKSLNTCSLQLLPDVNRNMFWRKSHIIFFKYCLRGVFFYLIKKLTISVPLTVQTAR